MSHPALERGLLIVFEGIDGSGKTTHSRLLGDFLETQGSKVVRSKEPTDGAWGRKIRSTASTGRLSPEEELEYFLKDREEHVRNVITPSLWAGKTVILDRYYFSTMAYQGARGSDPIEIQRLNEAFAPVPDLLFILDLEVEAALGRIGARGDTANEFEKEDSLSQCRKIFLSLEKLPYVHIVPTLDGTDAVQTRIREIALLHQGVK